MQPSGALLTALELATALGVSRATILRRAREGAIPTHRLGAKAIRFVLAEVLEATAERPAPAAIPPPKVTRLSPEAADFFYGRQARGDAAQSRRKRKAARGI